MSQVFELGFGRRAGASHPIPFAGTAWAYLRVGEFVEHFVIPIGHWSREQYRSQWYDAAVHLLTKRDVSVFLVDVWADWALMSKTVAWVAYREGDDVHVQNVILWPKCFAHLEFRMAHLAVPARTLISEEPETYGLPVSEWRKIGRAHV